jgi:hypothetical protein
MNRALVFLAATAAAALAVTSACLASPKTNHDFRAEDIYFTMTAPARSGDVQLSLRSGNDRHNHSMSSGFAASELAGLDLARLRSPASAPLSFALVRQAGRVDCSGNARAMKAEGDCRFTADAAFAELLASRGIGRPTAEESYELTMVGATRELVDALQVANYPRPTIEKLTELAAVGVDRQFIDELSRRGYRPNDLDELVEFGALDITPDYIDGMARAGFRNMDADAIVQFKALDISPAYIAELARIGYSGLDADEVTELKALEVTPEFVEGFARIGYSNLPVDTLVQLKALDVTPEYVKSLRDRGLAELSPEQLVALRAVGKHYSRRK